jgi:hypothetical protein
MSKPTAGPNRGRKVGWAAENPQENTDIVETAEERIEVLESQVRRLIEMNRVLTASLEEAAVDVSVRCTLEDRTTLILGEIDELRRSLARRPLHETAKLLCSGAALQQEWVGWLESCPMLIEDHIARLSTCTKAGERTKNALRDDGDSDIARAHRHVADLMRDGHQHAISLYHYARSIAADYMHVHSATRRTDCLEGTAVSEKQIYNLRELLSGIPIELPYVPDPRMVWLNTDNLNIYARRATRVKETQRVQSVMLDALVTERIHFDPVLLHGLAPPTAGLLNHPSTYDLETEFTPEKDEWHAWLTGFWQEFKANAQTDPMAVLNRPAASEDLHTQGRTITESLPILCGITGGRKGDAAKYFKMVGEIYGEDVCGLHEGDWATFRQLWAETVEKFAQPNHLPKGDELHEEMHLVHAGGLNWGDHVMLPAAMRLFRVDIRKTFEAARHNSKSSFIRAITVAGLRYLSECAIPAELLDNPLALMAALKKNVPLWDFVGFLFYFGVFMLGFKKAMRIGKVDDLDKSWRHMSILARATNKTNYSIYGLMMARVLFDTVPWVRSLLDNDRTYRETDKPCTGRGKGTVIERVTPQLESQ